MLGYGLLGTIVVVVLILPSMLTPGRSLFASRKRASSPNPPVCGSKFTMNRRCSPYSPEFKMMRRLSSSAEIQWASAFRQR
jgi:hypothetical protein